MIEARRKKKLRWEEERIWIPPIEDYGKKLKLTNHWYGNVKFGPSVKKPVLKLSRVDVK